MFRSMVELLEYPTIQDMGRQVEDYTATPAATPIRGVDLQPGASTELVAQRRDVTGIRWTVFIPLRSVQASGVVLTDKSIIRVRAAEICEVDGQPMEWVDGSPLDYYIVALKFWKVPS